MNIILIAGVLKGSNIIGIDGKLACRSKEDMEYFKETTMGNICAMRRETWESIPPAYRPLDGRLNIVITRKGTSYGVPKDVLVATTTDEAVQLAKSSSVYTGNSKYTGKDLYLCGGQGLYEEGMKIANKLEITWIETEIDTSGSSNIRYFPKIDSSIWTRINLSPTIAPAGKNYRLKFATYDRIRH